MRYVTEHQRTRAPDQDGHAAVSVPEEPGRSQGPFLTVAAALFLLLAGANLPTPLYAVYQQRFGFSAEVLTLVFATYAVVLVPTLLVFGRLSDRLGRRRVIVAGLGAAAVAAALFAAAEGTAWLFAARAMQGLALGMVSGGANAGLVELEPRHDARRAALLATLAQTGGCAAGPLAAGMLAQWAPAPRTLCYLVGLTATVAIALGVLAVPEPARGTRDRVTEPARGSRSRRRIQRPGVPRAIRGSFARVALTAAVVWAVAALFLSVVPSYVGSLLGTHDLALLGAITAVMLAASCAAQLASRSGIRPARSQAGGLILLAAGLLALVAAFPAHSLALVLVGAVLAGCGHGAGFLGAQGELNRCVPGDRRGEVTAAFYTCVYTGVAVTSIGVGLIARAVSLSEAVALFAAVIGATALATACRHLRARRRHLDVVARGHGIPLPDTCRSNTPQ
ncbi:MFS transporter [Streptomyces sp. NRRL S-813]|uniref:MFS transporter n=1 Tax=Streptomyces sp. NRRL S-813 TaxID=1463919 RepID=UPI0006919B2A|nr:MFS transporter [Streptomyces sp. NRRL S-813]